MSADRTCPACGTTMPVTTLRAMQRYIEHVEDCAATDAPTVGTDFSIDHADDTRYRWDDRSGESVKVTMDAQANGERIGVYHYAADGDQLAFYRFRIDNADRRAIHVLNKDKYEAIPDAVVRALHVGGWEITNIERECITVTNPFEVQLLDIRDFFRSQARLTDFEFVAIYYEALANATEAIIVGQGTAAAADDDGKNVDDLLRGLAERRVGPDAADEFGPREMVEGMLLGAVPPQDSPAEHAGEIIEFCERARTYYHGGLDVDDAFDKASEEAPHIDTPDDA